MSSPVLSQPLSTGTKTRLSAWVVIWVCVRKLIHACTVCLLCAGQPALAGSAGRFAACESPAQEIRQNRISSYVNSLGSNGRWRVNKCHRYWKKHEVNAYVRYSYNVSYVMWTFIFEYQGRPSLSLPAHVKLNSVLADHCSIYNSTSSLSA